MISVVIFNRLKRNVVPAAEISDRWLMLYIKNEGVSINNPFQSTIFDHTCDAIWEIIHKSATVVDFLFFFCYPHHIAMQFHTFLRL